MREQATVHVPGAGVTDNRGSIERSLSTGEAAQLKALADELAALPVVDIQRVRDMRHRLASGSYRADPTRVAAKLLQFEAALRGTH